MPELDSDEGGARERRRTRPWPLTERILDRVPGPRLLSIGLWALVPWLNAGGNLLLDADSRSDVWDQRGMVVALSYAALSLAVVIALWGSRRIARALVAVESIAETVFEGDTRAAFREVGNAVGPLAVTLVAALAFATSAVLDDGALPALLRAGTWLILGVPIATFVWAYGALQLGLSRLGGLPIRQVRALRDPGLGLRPLGDVAFMGLWMLLALLVPVLLTALPDSLAVGICLVVLVAGLSTFFVSVYRLHRQMVKVKESELSLARELYAEAYAPVRAAPTLDVLDLQHGRLSAAEALEKRAKAIHDWPIDEGTFARVLTVATSVVGITIARLILDPFGL